MAATAFSLQAAVELAKDGKTEYTIIYEDKNADVLLDPAVRDLANSLKEITGAEFAVKTRADGPKIYIGKVAPGDKVPLQSRERRIKSVGKDLYIYGDYRYGTAGAIYNFLTKFCGCRWYTAAGDKKIPRNPDLSFPDFNYSHVPSFKSLEHGSKGVGSALNPDIRDWVRRNNSFLMPKYAFAESDDAWNYIGPVTHTLAAYMPPIERKPRTFNADKTFFAGPHPVLADKRYFETNPEWFTLTRNGKRVHNMQLCFSQKIVRETLIENVQKVIDAEKYDPQQYAILDLTQNDRSGGFCFCKDCQKLNEKYATPGGAYFEFMVEAAEHFSAKYPKLSFRLFSYKEDMTGIPPTGLKFPDNLAVIIAPLEQDFSKSFSHKYNQHFLKQMRQWSKICKEVWLWNYPTLYTHGMKFYSLFPGVYRNTENLRLAHAANVRYLIAEQGGSAEEHCSFKELNIYLQCLMAEDLNVDVDAAIKEFCDAVYGAAADDMIAYLKDADAKCKADTGFFRYFNDPRVMRKVVHAPATLVAWNKAFDAMEKKVKNDARALFHVRRARLNLDSITILCYPEIAAADPAFAKKNPLTKLYRRYCRNIRKDVAVIHRNHPDKGIIRRLSDSYIVAARMAYEFNRRIASQSYPEELVKKYGAENLYTVMPCQSRRAPAMWDKTTASGYAVRIPKPGKNTNIVIQKVWVGKKDGLPWNYREMIPLRKRFLTAADMKKIEAAEGYQLIYCGRHPLSVAGVVQIATLPERNVRFFLGAVYDQGKPSDKYDFYFSFKNSKNGYLIDRLVLARVPQK